MNASTISTCALMFFPNISILTWVLKKLIVKNNGKARIEFMITLYEREKQKNKKWHKIPRNHTVVHGGSRRGMQVSRHTSWTYFYLFSGAYRFLKGIKNPWISSRMQTMFKGVKVRSIIDLNDCSQRSFIFVGYDRLSWNNFKSTMTLTEISYRCKALPETWENPWKKN